MTHHNGDGTIMPTQHQQCQTSESVLCQSSRYTPGKQRLRGHALTSATWDEAGRKDKRVVTEQCVIQTSELWLTRSG